MISYDMDIAVSGPIRRMTFSKTKHNIGFLTLYVMVYLRIYNIKYLGP